MGFPVYLLAPAVAAALYALGSLGLKKAMDSGVEEAKTNAFSNYAMVAWSLPLLFFLPGRYDGSALAGAAGAGVALFLGRIFSVKALQTGDLSLVTPILAAKTILVAFLSLIFKSGHISWRLLVAAAMTSLAVALLQRGPAETRGVRRSAVLYALLASLLFAGTDVLTQTFARQMGVGWFQPILFGTTALLTPLLVRNPIPARGLPPLAWGSCTMGFQTSLMILTIDLTGQATLVNIVYSTRSI